VENYLRDHGLTDRVKVLRIYDMSVPRGAAHHTCHLAPVRRRRWFLLSSPPTTCGQWTMLNLTMYIPAHHAAEFKNATFPTSAFRPVRFNTHRACSAFHNGPRRSR